MVILRIPFAHSAPNVATYFEQSPVSCMLYVLLLKSSQHRGCMNSNPGLGRLGNARFEKLLNEMKVSGFANKSVQRKLY